MKTAHRGVVKPARKRYNGPGSKGVRKNSQIHVRLVGARKGEPMTKLKKYLLYAGFERKEIQKLLPEVREENGRCVRIYLGISASVFLACLLMSFAVGGALAVNQPVYAVMLAISVVLYGCARAILPAHPRLSTLISVLYILSMYGFSFTISMTHGSIPATAAVAILLVMPALFTYRPIYMISMTILAIFAHFWLATIFKPMDVALLDLWNSLFFGSIAIMLSIYLMQIKFRLLSQKRANQVLGETDILTGTRNRNCFERRRKGYAEKCRDNLTCVFVDVNGLHELNDTKGHEAGDTMLQTVARAMIDKFGQADTYRIGGDEFVSFCLDSTKEEVRRRVADLIREVKERGYSVSVGASMQAKQEINIDEIVKQAEHYMYIEKRAYYQNGGRDRRHVIEQG